MPNIDEILFSKTTIKKPVNKFDILFTSSIDWDTDMVNVDVSYFSLKKDKILEDDNIVSANEQLVGVDVCNKTGMINVCHFDEDYHRYFWVNPDEVYTNTNTTKEHWELEDVRRHLKAIKEEWTTKKNIKKESKPKRNKQK